MSNDQADELLREMNLGVKPGEPLQFALAFRPMPNGSLQLLKGYRALHMQESNYAYRALREQRSGFELWYHLLTLGDDLVRREHDFTSEIAQLPAAHLRLRLASVSISTAKLILDACASGYYTQALGLMRPMIEAWKTMAYVAIHPANAQDWFPGDDGVLPKKPDRKAMNTALDLDERFRDTLVGANRLIRYLDGHAHLSPEALVQTNADREGIGIFGATYREDHCRMVISWATFCVMLILHELSRDDSSLPSKWSADLKLIESLRTVWHQQQGLGSPPEKR